MLRLGVVSILFLSLGCSASQAIHTVESLTPDSILAFPEDRRW